MVTNTNQTLTNRVFPKKSNQEVKLTQNNNVRNCI